MRLLLLVGLLAFQAMTTAPASLAQSSPADTSAPVITLWSEPQLSFSAIGIPQPFLNIVGNVGGPNGVDSLSYSLNGDSAVRLSVGPDMRRLSRKGDFNIDIKADDLKKWPARNRVTIMAFDSLGRSRSLDVDVTSRAPRRWPLPYSVSLTTATSLSDSAQLVDGTWTQTNRGIMPVETGYDRLVAIGDTAWRDYEVSAEITVLGIDSSDQSYNQINGGPAVGFIMRWNGHSDNPKFTPPITQPISGYLPLGAIGWFHWRRGAPDTWELMGNNLRILGRDTTDQLEFATTYRFKMQVLTRPDSTSRYSFKKWKKSEREPGDWLLTGLQAPEHPRLGSLLLVAHHVKALFANVTVTPLGGDINIADVRTIVGENSAYVTWKTTGPGTGTLLFGKSLSSPDTARMDSGIALTHEALLPGLAPSTTYRIRIEGTGEGGAEIGSVQASFTTPALSSGPTFQSDRFDSTVVDSSRWVLFNTRPPATISMVRENSAQALSIEVPAVPSGGSPNGRIAPRIMQPVANRDLQVQAKFLSLPELPSHVEGIMVEEDFDRFLTFELMSDSGGVRLTTTSFDGDSTQEAASVMTSADPPLYLRVTRRGDRWRAFVSHDSLNWAVAANFNSTMRVNGIGLFIGVVTDTDSTAGAFKGIVDHFVDPTVVWTDVAEGSAEVPLEFGLDQNYPNPFNPRTEVRSQMSAATQVKLVVYDLLGREVAVLVDEWRPAGRYEDTFDGAGLASGVYLYRLTAGNFVATRKMLLMK